MINEKSVQPPFAVNESLEQPPVPGLGSFVRLSGDAEQVSDSLGPLADLVGTWVGNHGWNMVAVPQGDNFSFAGSTVYRNHHVLRARRAGSGPRA